MGCAASTPRESAGASSDRPRVRASGADGPMAIGGTVEPDQPGGDSSWVKPAVEGGSPGRERHRSADYVDGLVGVKPTGAKTETSFSGSEPSFGGRRRLSREDQMAVREEMALRAAAGGPTGMPGDEGEPLEKPAKPSKRRSHGVDLEFIPGENDGERPGWIWKARAAEPPSRTQRAPAREAPTARPPAPLRRKRRRRTRSRGTTWHRSWCHRPSE